MVRGAVAVVDDLTSRSPGPAVVSGLGLVLVGLEIWHVFEMDTPIGQFLEAGLPLVLAVLLVWAGVWLHGTDIDGDSVRRVCSWFVVGIVTMLLVTTWVIAHQLIRGLPFHHVTFVLTNTAVVGGIGGLIVGVYDARSRTREAALTNERERMAFLNHLLRHHVLNQMNVILGRTSALYPYVDADGRAHLDTLTACGDDVVELIQRVRTFTGALSDTDDPDLEPVNLSRCLEREVERLRRCFDDATVVADVPSAVAVVADNLLSEVFSNVLFNAVQHNPSSDARVTVTVERTGESVVVSVADNGPGIPDDVRANLSGTGEVLLGGSNHGIGLAIASALVARYDGSIRAAHRAGTGSVVSVELRRAAAVPSCSGSECGPEGAPTHGPSRQHSAR